MFASLTTNLVSQSHMYGRLDDAIPMSRTLPSLGRKCDVSDGIPLTTAIVVTWT